MDFTNELYPEHGIHIALYSNITELDQLKTIMSDNLESISICNAELVISIKHLLFAINRAFHNYSSYKIKTKTLPAEIVYSLSPINQVKESLRLFGVEEAKKIFIIFIDSNNELIKDVKNKLSEIGVQEIPIEEISNISNIVMIRNVFKITPTEELLENGLEQTIYTKIALKNI